MKALGFAGTGRNDTESMQWVQNEKEHLATLMQQRGLGWKKLVTHEKHLSVYNYEKKMRKQEVEELERRLQDKADTMGLQERCMESNWKQLSTQRKCLEELEQSCRQWEVKQEEAEDRYLHYLSWNVINFRETIGYCEGITNCLQISTASCRMKLKSC